MNYSDALDAAKAGFYITTSGRYNPADNSGPFLAWNAKRGYLEIYGPSHNPGEDGKPSPWNAQPGDLESTDWIVLAPPNGMAATQAARDAVDRHLAALMPAEIRKPSYMVCLYCGMKTEVMSPDMVSGRCLHCHHQIMLAALAGVAGEVMAHDYSNTYLAKTAIEIADAVLAQRAKRDA